MWGTEEPWTGASWTATDESDGRFLLRLLPLDRATCDPAVSACFCFERRSNKARKRQHGAKNAYLAVMNKGSFSLS